ncbi:thiamine phosphate synthase [Aureivirga sp. CE67]|uniref:thiamine phosphate synthase n=1 Tax=Aureivirga sp. CE67 TaxID=1788983 RepID=UPI0018CA750E|nr:thiamine phosphate synthase [Aureivirga sp. CE67]
MFVVIATEKNNAKEIDIIIQLFELGLETFHLRKPNFTKEMLISYLNKVPEKYHKHIVIDSHIELLEDFHLKGFHLKESNRLKLGNDLKNIRKKLFDKQQTLSSSFHSLEAIENNNIEFDYVFLSPVFHSISKENYAGKGFDVNHLKQKTLALGGIKQENIAKTKELGFQGIAVLGAIWESEDPILEFQRLKEVYDGCF